MKMREKHLKDLIERGNRELQQFQEEQKQREALEAAEMERLQEQRLRAELSVAFAAAAGHDEEQICDIPNSESRLKQRSEAAMSREGL